MRISWDPRKSAATFARREFDFAFASLIFDGVTIETSDRRRDYGEQRVIAIGLADGKLLTVVYTDRTEAGETTRRIISAREASRNERKAYFEATAEGRSIQGKGQPGTPREPFGSGD